MTLIPRLTTYEFDDISTISGLANIPSPYHYLSLSFFNVLKPHDPALKGLISEHDLNCAVSSPNALLGSRPSENADGAYFQIANATAMKEQGLHPYFTLQSLYIKPMDAPAPGTTVYVKGYGRGRQDTLVWQVEFPSGYHLPLKVNMQEFSGEEWKEIDRIEIVADFGYDSLDWEFCVDDIELQFFALSKGKKYEYMQTQLMLGPLQNYSQPELTHTCG